MNITPHFTKEELERSNTATRLGLPNVCPDELLNNMQKVADRLESLRTHLGVPIHVLSCYRSPAVNNAVGGSPTSAHRFALAADCQVDGLSVLSLCEKTRDLILDYDQIIYEFGEQGWMHVGFATNPRKQLLTAAKEGTKTVYSQGLIA